MIPSNVREEVRARTDIADLIGQYVPLRRSGSSLVARCPFHQEKSPSFHVSKDRGLFHCFGCKASGDIFTFYERIEGVNFPEALRALAQRAGVEVVEEERDPSRIAEEKRTRELSERLIHACEVATAFFERSLREAEHSAMARDELHRRAVSADVAVQFRLGYAPAQWDGLAEQLRKHSVSPSDAELAGLLLGRKTGSGYYDRFRHRLMFPIWDRNGKVVAFSGRVLPVSEDMPEGLVPADAGKYINSPETPLYKKSELLFGLQMARTAMRQKAEAIVVEGNFDVVTMHEHGFTETVAPLGTAFTETQGSLLRRFAESVTLVFDGDEAGRKAARAAHAVCAKAGLIARVAVLPRGKDPDEVLRGDPNGREWLQERIKHAPAIVEWLIEDTAAHTADNTPARIAALRALAPVLVTVADSLERDVYVEQVVRVLHVNERQVRQAMREAEQAARAERHNPFVQRGPSPQVGRDEPFRKRVVEDTGEGASSASHVQGTPVKRTDSVSAATAEAIDALLRTPSLLATDIVDDLLPLLDVAFAQPLVAEAREQWLSRGQLDGPTLLALAPNDKARAWIGERLVPAGEVETQDEKFEQALRDSLVRLRAVRDQDSARVLKIESAKARASGDEDSEMRLLRQKLLIDKQRLNAKKNRGSA